MRVIRQAQAVVDLLIRRLVGGPADFISPCARAALDSLPQLGDAVDPTAVLDLKQIEKGLHALQEGIKMEDGGGILEELRVLSGALREVTFQEPSNTYELRLPQQWDEERISDERLRSLLLISDGDLVDVFADVAYLLNTPMSHPLLIRSFLEYWFFPRRKVQNIADLGAGIGLASLRLAHHYPEAEIWAVDLGTVRLLENPDSPPDVINFGGHLFSDFQKRHSEGCIPSMDLVYILFPTPAEAEEYCQVAAQILMPQGFIHVVTDSPFFMKEACHLWEKAGFVTRWAVIPDLFRGLSVLSHDFDLGTHALWLVARRG